MNYGNIGNAYIADKSGYDIPVYTWLEANQDKFTDIDFQELKEVYHGLPGDKDNVLGLVDKILKSRLIKIWTEP